MHKVSCEGRKPLVWGYLDAQSCWRSKLSKTRGAKVTSLWIWRAQLPLNTRLEAQDLVASMQLQKPPIHQVLPKNKVGWDGEAKDKQGSCHHMQRIFHFENRGD